MDYDSIFESIDHVTYRVSSCAASGLFFGASLATFRGLPLPHTTLSMGTSFALVSTACFVPERLFYHASFYIRPRLDEIYNDSAANVNVDVTASTKGSEDFSSTHEILERNRLYVSHGMGGMMGGSITGGLFRGRSGIVSGILLLTPMMLMAAHGEMKLNAYKEKRLRELKVERSQEKNEKRRWE